MKLHISWWLPRQLSKNLFRLVDLCKELEFAFSNTIICSTSYQKIILVIVDEESAYLRKAPDDTSGICAIEIGAANALRDPSDVVLIREIAAMLYRCLPLLNVSKDDELQLSAVIDKWCTGKPD